MGAGVWLLAGGWSEPGCWVDVNVIGTVRHWRPVSSAAFRVLLQFPDTVEAALREADRDHDGVVSMQVVGMGCCGMGGLFALGSLFGVGGLHRVGLASNESPRCAPAAGICRGCTKLAHPCGCMPAPNHACLLQSTPATACLALHRTSRSSWKPIPTTACACLRRASPATAAAATPAAAAPTAEAAAELGCSGSSRIHSCAAALMLNCQAAPAASTAWQLCFKRTAHFDASAGCSRAERSKHTGATSGAGSTRESQRRMIQRGTNVHSQN